MNRSAQQRRCWVPAALRASAPGYAGRFGLWQKRELLWCTEARGSCPQLIAFGFVTRAACIGARPGTSLSWQPCQVASASVPEQSSVLLATVASCNQGFVLQAR